MESQLFDSLGSELKQAALESFINFRDSYAWKLEQENKYLAEYKSQYEKQMAKCVDLEKSLKKYEELIAAVGVVPLQVPDSIPSPETLPEVEPVPDPKDEFFVPARRIQYPSSPKGKLKELVYTSSSFTSDEELLNKLRSVFGIQEIPMKTVNNYLLELNSEGIIRRVKSKKLGKYISGPVEWFDENGIPKSEYIKE